MCHVKWSIKNSLKGPKSIFVFTFFGFRVGLRVYVPGVPGVPGLCIMVILML